MTKYQYNGLKNRNVVYNGVSFPVTTKDILEGTLDFLKNFLPENELKEIDVKVVAKYRFPRTDFANVFRKDPMGGLPGRSTFLRKVKLSAKDEVSSSIGKEKIDNPYQEQTERKVAEVSTRRKVSAAVPSVAQEEPTKLEDSVTTEVKELTERIEAEVEKLAVTSSYSDVYVPTRTHLRKLLKPEILKLSRDVIETNCVLKPEMLDKFKAVNEDTFKGIIFDLLWEYFDLDKKEE
jgi:hypothetical protein